MPETSAGSADLSAPDDLISFLKAIPDGLYRRGVRYPPWFMVLVEVLGILSGCRSSRGDFQEKCHTWAAVQAACTM
jgi:hypothetical protein